jgi:deoxyribodipyrimidine photolyase-related protein
MKLRLILGDQLNRKHSWYSDSEEAVYVMMETKSETGYVKHHIQKVIAFFRAMRHHAQWLRSQGKKVDYLTINDSKNLHNFEDNIYQLLSKHGATSFEYQSPDEYRLEKVMKRLCQKMKLDVKEVDTEHFLTSRFEVRAHFQGKKTFIMESFYRNMRKKHGILMEMDQPLGGKWNFDAENRNKWKGKPVVPEPINFISQEHVEIAEEIKKAGIETIGKFDVECFYWPSNPEETEMLQNVFVQDLLPHFGAYQDAMDQKEAFLFHSRLSFSLNVKMLHPRLLIERVESEHLKNPERVGIAQAEGFIRQILGWREYVRGIYWDKMPDYASMNFFEHERALPEFYWTGDCKMNCLSKSITNSLDNAYAHHIQRLMITGNFALLAGIHPDAVDEWYLGIYADAIEWVEMPNTRGMSQYADGGIMATKPYVSSANYIHKMSSYCSNCTYSRTKRTGEDACPFNYLYWNFLMEHREKLSGNRRMSMMLRLLDKIPVDEKEKIQEESAAFLESLST